MSERPVVIFGEDDPDLRELLQTMFTMHGGFRIGGAGADGLEAAMMAADSCPDVVVLDMATPRWDGNKSAEFLKERCPETKIVVFTGSVGKAPEWADRFVVKRDIDRLIAVVEEVCGMTPAPKKGA